MSQLDLIVVGSGPAGEKGAVQAAYFGKRVAVIERHPVLGGAPDHQLRAASQEPPRCVSMGPPGLAG